jgi:hypothetical protein
LRNCKIKLSDSARDNFFRTANCGLGIADPAPIRNVHLIGEGYALLEGADHPRATGDSSKLLHAPCPHYPEDICKIADWIPEERRTPDKITFLDIHNHSYGTDAGKTEESQYGDWRGIGVLFANAENFTISGITVKESHGWGISIEACTYGVIEKITFDARMHKNIDGMEMNMENQDGIDVRNGCHHITISDVRGCTGDDVIALTAIANPDTAYIPGGSFRSTHVMHNDYTRREKDIHDIEIRSVTAHSYLCWVVRLLPGLTYIYNVVIDGVIDDEPEIKKRGGTLNLGDGGTYAENLPDSMRNITISNVVCNSCFAVAIRGYLTDSVITNVINKNPDCEAITVTRENGTKNVAITGVITAK